MEVTAETITDEQIRELCVIAYREVRYGLIEICNGALAGGPTSRACCAEIINERAKEQGK